MEAGMKPPSKAPIKARVIRKPVLFVMNAWKHETVPQANIKNGNHLEKPSREAKSWDGNSIAG